MAPPLLDAPETFDTIGVPGSEPVLTLGAQRDALVDRTQGRILHVGARGRDAAGLAAALSQLDGGPFDSVVSVLGVTTAPNPADVLDLLVKLVSPGGRLFLLESTRRPADAFPRPIAGRVSDRFRSRRSVELQSALRTDLDIPTMVRSSGFSPTRVERFGLGSNTESAVFVSIEAGRRSELRPLDHAAEESL